MTGKLLDLSGKIDGFTIELFESIKDVAESVSVPFFVVGAMARDMILKYGYNIETIRATNDIDFGVLVSDWDQYNVLKESLIAKGGFESTKEAQRLQYKGSLIIDIIPFGGIEDPDKFFSWPPDNENKMSTLGFEESYAHSLVIRLRRNPDLDIKFATQAGLALMKIISWNDRYPERNRDAKDLVLLMRTYLDGGNSERLFEEEVDILEIVDFDYVRAGARLLGRDMAAIANLETRETILRILEAETGEKDRYRLVEDMTDISIESGSNFEENIELLEMLKAGILEGPSSSR